MKTPNYATTRENLAKEQSTFSLLLIVHPDWQRDILVRDAEGVGRTREGRKGEGREREREREQGKQE